MNQRQLTVAVAANFTPDLVRPAVAHWLGELGIAHLHDPWDLAEIGDIEDQEAPRADPGKEIDRGPEVGDRLPEHL